MKKFANTAVSVVLLALMLCSAACDVYDASLSRQSQLVSKADAAAMHDTGIDASLDGAADEVSASCGNGVVDPGERCDVAIAAGRSGACPEGCSGREGCRQRVLVGSECAARCVDVLITQPIPDDGCCPSEATASQDDDCASSCGNGVVERGEHCDPPETCAKKSDCISSEVCQRAHYTGDPNACTAMCELQRVHACLNDDGCCPPGCSEHTDNDCGGSDADCDAGCVPPAGEGAANASRADASFDCKNEHGSNSCLGCDCGSCAAEVSNCLNTPGEGEGDACDALSRCAAKNQCTGIDCYCGNLNAQACELVQPGPCVAEVRAAAGTRDVNQLIALASASEGAMARWTKLMDCRKSKCSRECDVRGNGP